MNLNKVILIGRLTRDPETRALPSGQSVTSFGLATDRYFVDKSGQKQQQTEFHNIVTFGKLADISSQYLNKGSLVSIEGRLQTRSWEDASGSKRSRTEIVAATLQMGPRSAATARSFNQNQQPPKPQENKKNQEPPQEDIPIVEEDDINPKDIPF